MKIYTKTGDQGETSLYGGQRVGKDHLRIDTFGTVDELNATLGMARAEVARLPEAFAPIGQVLGHAQNHLFDLGAELATPEAAKKGTELLGPAATATLESAIDHWDSQLPPLTQFILPGGSELAARLHVSRCVCRRAERVLVTLMRAETLRPEPAVYLNRLGDLLFVLARAANHLSKVPDVAWKKSGT
ncbi:cob(I)yrinic acid a,c-diamide adenosyltransferase [Aeoliella sp. ICT_H6.2]|uniref:Corrinoid adenosyltransferase n=1 Tax=Aeoliella straminimaris TaxID=2954799 RepID=A0A9X2FB39_9BACT|nr:cob(I)yrinic acid a,c-diamide adenosyltransferase [Aeoliella straminimaris]MCO6045707.1 cob(I)yrinic acid a,c-diamide adenosyltransferase [Aeoliella straminimaris]